MGINVNADDVSSDCGASGEGGCLYAHYDLGEFGVAGFVAVMLLIFGAWVGLWVVTASPALDNPNAEPLLLTDAGTFAHGVTGYAAVLVSVFYLGEARRHIAGTRRMALRFFATSFATPAVYRSLQALLHKCGDGCYPVLSTVGMKALAPAGWFLIVCAFATVTWLGAYHARLASRVGVAGRYALSLMCVAVPFVTLASVGARWGGVSLHIHHYMWAGTLAMFCIFDTPVSCVAQAVLLGIVTQEMSYRGARPFFDKAADLGS